MSKRINKLVKKYQAEFKHFVSAEKLNDYEEVRRVFLLNFDESHLFRKDFFIEVYGKDNLDKCELEWENSTYKDKCEWYDLQTNHKNNIGDFANVMLRLKTNRGNLRKTYKQIKEEALTKKAKEIIEEEEEEEEDKEDYDFEEDDDDESPQRNYDDDEGGVNNTLDYAYIVSKPSEVSKNFRELPKEVKHAFLNRAEKREIQHRARTYNTFMYIKKLLKMGQIEDSAILENRKDLKEVTTPQELEDAFRKINRYYLFKELEKANLIDEVLDYIAETEESGFDEDINNINEHVVGVFEYYRSLKKDYSKPEYVDDTGNMGEIMATAISTSGEGGNERYAGITSISATREMDVIADKKKDTEYKRPSIIDRVRRRFS